VKIDADRVIAQRVERSWSQEELAIASGLSLRTVQRVENTGHASLQTRKSIAAALELHTRDLDPEEDRTVTQYEYKTVDLQAKGILKGLRSPTPEQVTEFLNRQGAAGWRLAATGSSFDFTKTILILEREKRPPAG
jgi:transcriptional regulator with XRE-family HTH domain